MAFCYSDNGQSMRAVEDGYKAAKGEVIFPDYPTQDQLAAAFPAFAEAKAKQLIEAQIFMLENAVTPRRLREAQLEAEQIVTSHTFKDGAVSFKYGTSGKPFVAYVDAAIKALRA